MTFPRVRAAQPSRARRRVNAYALAFGLGVHAVLAALVLTAHVREAPPESRAIQIELAPRTERPRPTPSRTAPAMRPTPPALAPRPTAEAPVAPVELPASSGAPADAPPGQVSGMGTSTGSRTVFPPPPSASAVLRRGLGCSHAEYVKLTPVEQAACDRQFAGNRPKAQEIAKAVDAAMDPSSGIGPFAQAGRQNQAKRKYRDAPGVDGYTSLRCNLLGRC